MSPGQRAGTHGGAAPQSMAGDRGGDASSVSPAPIAVVAYFWREKPADVVIEAPAKRPGKPAPAGQNKIADRIDATGSAGSAPTVVETPIPTVTVPVARVPAPAPGSPQPRPSRRPRPLRLSPPGRCARPTTL